MLRIEKTTDSVILNYFCELGNPNWLAEKLELIESKDENSYEDAVIARTFYIRKDIYIINQDAMNYREGEEEKSFVPDFDDGKYSFVIAKKVGEYYQFDNAVLDIDFDLYIHESIELSQKSFVQYKNISVFKKINSVYFGKALYIGGDKATLSGEYFEILLSHFPNSYEIDKYINARIASVLRNEISTIQDYVKMHEDYLNKKTDTSKRSYSKGDIVVLKNDISKFDIFIEKLKNMLQEYTGYSEKEWQNEIVKIFRIMYPKYIQTLEKMRIQDFYTHNYREIDIVLVDASGYIDIVEIKKPQATSLLYEGLYRSNYVPIRELQGTVMQVENYILSIIKMGSAGEEKLNRMYSDYLENGLQMKIVNPKGIIIMGLEKEMNEKQKNDFEIVKRMYNNVIDIITYDELLIRLENICSSLKNELYRLGI